MNSRRSVLRILGFTPLATKVAADKAISDLSGISMNAVGGIAGGTISGVAPIANDSTADSWKKKVLRFLVDRKLPRWVEEDLPNRYRQVGYLDPDIASKKSWSMNVKIATQRLRNIERAKQQMLDGPRLGMLQREFEERYGVWL